MTADTLTSAATTVGTGVALAALNLGIFAYLRTDLHTVRESQTRLEERMGAVEREQARHRRAPRRARAHRARDERSGGLLMRIVEVGVTPEDEQRLARIRAYMARRVSCDLHGIEVSDESMCILTMGLFELAAIVDRTEGQPEESAEPIERLKKRIDADRELARALSISVSTQCGMLSSTALASRLTTG